MNPASKLLPFDIKFKRLQIFRFLSKIMIPLTHDPLENFEKIDQKFVFKILIKNDSIIISKIGKV